MTQKFSILLISGKRSSGKTTFCSLIAKILKSSGWDVAGLISLPIIEEGEQIAKDALNIRSGVRHRLANINFDSSVTTEVQIGQWIFDSKTLDWCNAVFQSSIPCEFLLVDEIGPLEFNKLQGFRDALTALDSGQFLFAIVVIRPNLLTAALQRWPTAKIVEVTDPNHAEKQAVQLAAEMTSDLRPHKK